MTKIDELIKKLCPNGVEKVCIKPHLESLPKEIVKNDYITQTGIYPVINSGRTIQGFYDKFNNDGNAIAIASRGESAGFIHYSKSCFWAGGLCYPYRSKDEKILCTKFLYYYLKVKEDDIQNRLVARGGIPAINKADFERYEIPLPPLAIQQEIVNTLDKFTSLIDKIDEEISLRQKQYEYYREKLLTFEDGEVEWKKLGEVAEIGTGSRNTQDGLAEGLYPFYTRGQEILRMNVFDYDETAIITAGDGAGVGKTFHFVNEKYALHQRAYRFVPLIDFIVPKFLYNYIQCTFYNYIMKNSVFGSVPSVRKPMLERYMIPVPSLERQQTIVQTLDKFETLISKLKEERALRQKQYEYYREKLLTF